MPLEAIRAHEVIDDIMPVAFRHNLRLPSDLWLLGKTMAMMEGVGLKLVPDFDIFAVSEPYVQRFMRQLVSPRSWGPPLIKGINDWSTLMRLIPRVSSQVLTRVEREGIEIRIDIKELDQVLGRVDRQANRLSLSMLLAALIVGLALLVPAFNLRGQWTLATVVVIIGFIIVSLLGLWLIFSIWRASRK
jgi:ubiquinone biosynthesis protein